MLVRCSVCTLTEIHNCGKFHQLTILKILHTNSDPQNGPFWKVFWPLLPYSLTPKYGPILPKFLPQVVLQQTKALFEIFWRISSFYGEGTDRKLALVVQFWPSFSPWRWSKSKKISSCAEELLPLVYPNMSKSTFYLLYRFREKYDYFLQYLGYFCQETGWSHKSEG